MTDLSPSHLPPNRKRSEAECKATVMLLNGADRGNYWYGSNAHVIIWDGDWEEDAIHGNVSSRSREYYDADTMEKITRSSVGRRIDEYEAYMNYLMDSRKARTWQL